MTSNIRMSCLEKSLKTFLILYGILVLMSLVAVQINTNALDFNRSLLGTAGSCISDLAGGIVGWKIKAMPFSAQAETEEEQYILAASLDNVRNLSNILKAIHFRDHATCFATTNGLKVTVENAKCMQANAFVQVRCSLFGPLTVLRPKSGAFTILFLVAHHHVMWLVPFSYNCSSIGFRVNLWKPLRKWQCSGSHCCDFSVWPHC